MKKLSAFLASIVLTGVLSAETKFGVIDLKYVLENYKERAVAQTEINEEQLAIQEEKEAKQEELKEVTMELEALNTQLQDPTLSDKKRQAIQKEFGEKRAEAQKQANDLNEYFRRKGAKLQEKFQEKNTQIVNKIKEATQEFGKANGYTYIMDSNALVFSAESEDISDDIIKILNK